VLKENYNMDPVDEDAKANGIILQRGEENGGNTNSPRS